MNDDAKPRTHGRKRKDWVPLNTRISPEARNRLTEHKRIMGIEMGAILNALILANLDPTPADRFFPLNARGHGEILVCMLTEAGLEFGELPVVMNMLSRSAGCDPEADPFDVLLDDSAQSRSLLRRAIKGMRGTHQPPEGENAMTWLRHKSIALRVAEGLCQRIAE